MRKNSVIIKEYLDNIAESKVGEHPDMLQECKNNIYDILKKQNLSSQCRKMWNSIQESDYNQINVLKSVFTEKYHKYFDNLEEIRKNFCAIGIQIFINSCVIRSHENIIRVPIL